jgi:hypothetical protein
MTPDGRLVRDVKMTGMKRSLLLSIVAVGLALAGCGSKQTLHYTTTPPTTISGVGVTTSGPPPKPSTPPACAGRWNGATTGLAAARQRAPKADRALIRMARRRGYFREDAGRCLIYLITPPESAVVFVETAPGRFTFTADATSHFSANADLQQNGRLHLH